MKNLYRSIGIAVLVSAIVIFAASCGDLDDGKLDVPLNIKIEIDTTKSPTRQIMVITWNEVSNASGYEIHSVSVGCGSATRLINTKDGTAFGLTYESTDTQKTGPFTVGTASVLWDSVADPNKGVNGRVEIIGKNKIEITLMPENNVANTIHASQLRVKIKALGDGNEYTDSDYSEEVIKNNP